MDYLLLIQSLIPLLNAAIAAANLNGAPADEILRLENALNELSQVYGTEVTPGQLASLRVK